MTKDEATKQLRAVVERYIGATLDEGLTRGWIEHDVDPNDGGEGYFFTELGQERMAQLLAV
jgi:hypothetical protein